jgi:hypothetical protein
MTKAVVFRFKCASCDEWHEGMPSFGTKAPLYYYDIPEAERDQRCQLNTDFCIVDNDYFFVRGSVEICVEGSAEPFSWGLWVSLSRDSFRDYIDHFDSPERASRGPYFGWLAIALEVYPEDQTLRTSVQPRNAPLRPLIELEPSDHPLAIEQRDGIAMQRVGEIYAALMHD